MSNDTVNFRLYNLLKATDILTKETIAQEFGIKMASVPVYVHDFKKAHKNAEIEHVKGKKSKVVGYRLITKDLDVPQFRRNRTVKANSAVKKNDKAIAALANSAPQGTGGMPLLEGDEEDVDLNLESNEIIDLRSQLGISNNGYDVDGTHSGDDKY